MRNLLLSVCCGAAILAAGCSTLPRSNTAILQGAWQGRVIQGNPEAACHFLIAGNHFEFRDADTNVWYKGSFTLREDTAPKQFIATVSESSLPQYVGKTSLAIYRIEQDTLTITGNEPGNPAVPASFDAKDAVRVELKRE